MNDWILRLLKDTVIRVWNADWTVFFIIFNFDMSFASIISVLPDFVDQRLIVMVVHKFQLQ